MEIINKKEFTKTALDENIETFIVYIIPLNLNLMLIYLAQKTQIALLVIKKIQILFEYLNFSNVFLKKKALILLEATNLNQYAIEFQEGDK